MRQHLWLYLIAVLAIVTVLPLTLAVQIPFGANITPLTNQTAPIASPQVHSAIAGNVTLMNISGVSTTQSWQGYFGNVTGTVQLADSNGYAMYNWSNLNPSGQVYTSTADTINWYALQCFNFSATGAINSAGETPGGWNQKGMNLTQLQATYGINATDPDSVNNTFSLGGTGSHSTFYTASLAFPDTSCNSTRLYDTSGTSVPGRFQEVLQYEPTTNSVIFTSLINNDIPGFDHVTHDFQAMVLVNGHGTNTSTIPYYFYAQIT